MTLETASEVSSIKSGDFPTNDPQHRFCSEAGAGPRPCDQEAPAHESDDGARRNTNVFDTFRPREAPKAGGSCGQEDEPRKPGWKSAAVKKQRPAGLQRVSSVKCSKSKKGGQQITEKETYIFTTHINSVNESVNIDTCKGGAGDEKCGGGKCGDTYVIFNNPVLSGGGGSGVCGSCDGQIPQTLEELAGKVADILNKPSGEVMEALRRAQYNPGHTIPFPAESEVSYPFPTWSYGRSGISHGGAHQPEVILNCTGANDPGFGSIGMNALPRLGSQNNGEREGRRNDSKLGDQMSSIYKYEKDENGDIKITWELVRERAYQIAEDTSKPCSKACTTAVFLSMVVLIIITALSAFNKI